MRILLRRGSSSGIYRRVATAHLDFTERLDVMVWESTVGQDKGRFGH